MLNCLHFTLKNHQYIFQLDIFEFIAEYDSQASRRARPSWMDRFIGTSDIVPCAGHMPVFKRGRNYLYGSRLCFYAGQMLVSVWKSGRMDRWGKTSTLNFNHGKRCLRGFLTCNRSHIRLKKHIQNCNECRRCPIEAFIGVGLFILAACTFEGYTCGGWLVIHSSGTLYVALFEYVLMPRFAS